MVVTAGVRVTPLGPSHRKSGLSVTPGSRMTEQVRVTVSPAMMGEEGEKVRETVGDTVWGRELHCSYIASRTRVFDKNIVYCMAQPIFYILW